MPPPEKQAQNANAATDDLRPACVLHGPMPDFRIEAQRKAGWCKCPKPVTLNCQRDKEAESDA